MIACLAELIAKPGATQLLCDRVQTDILLPARQRKGYIDAVTLVCREESRLVLLLTVWQSEEDARAFDHEVSGPKSGVRQLIDHKRRVQTYDVCHHGGSAKPPFQAA